MEMTDEEVRAVRTAIVCAVAESSGVETDIREWCDWNEVAREAIEAMRVYEARHTAGARLVGEGAYLRVNPAPAGAGSHTLKVVYRHPMDETDT